MTVETVLYNTKVYFHDELVEAGIAIDEGKIVKIAKNTNLPLASTKINLNGHILLPGLIDTHVHLRDQKLAYKEDFSTGTAAAAAGGVTLVVDMPNNNPVTMDCVSIKERMNLARKQILVNVAFNSAFPEKIEEMSEIVKAGAVGFKIYLSNGIGGIDVNDDEQIFKGFFEAKKLGIPVMVHAEDRKILERRRKEMEREERNDVSAFVAAHPPEAESQAIKRVIQLVEICRVHAHVCHVSSAQGLNVVIAAKKKGLSVTCEVTPHNLFLDHEQYSHFGTLALTDPPLRTSDDLSALWRGLKGGFINVIASDHAPHSLNEKRYQSVWQTKPGIPGLETTLPLLLTQVTKGRLSFAELVRLVAEEPAKMFHLRKRGVIEEGNWADLVVVDMKREYKIDSSFFHSKAKYSPFDGMAVKGKPIKTFVNGKLVMDESSIVGASGLGKVVTGK